MAPVRCRALQSAAPNATPTSCPAKRNLKPLIVDSSVAKPRQDAVIIVYAVRSTPVCGTAPQNRQPCQHGNRVACRTHAWSTMDYALMEMADTTAPVLCRTALP